MTKLVIRSFKGVIYSLFEINSPDYIVQHIRDFMYSSQSLFCIIHHQYTSPSCILLGCLTAFVCSCSSHWIFFLLQNRIQLRDESDLFFRFVQTGDGGNYTCRVHLIDGDAYVYEQSAMLLVLGEHGHQ